MNKNSGHRDFIARLRVMKSDASKRFSILQAAHKVGGEFMHSTWSYAGSNVRFCVRPEKGAKASLDTKSLPGVAGLLARCFVVASMEKRLSPESICARLHGVRWLSQLTGGGATRWLALTPADLNRAIKNIQGEYGISTVYNRAAAISSFVSFLNATRIESDEGYTSVLGRHIVWHHGLKNPIRRSIEIDADDVDSAGQRKYFPQLHRALGEARSRIRKEPELEPSPGYDLIRLESLSFAMATGMRIGELCSLSVRCFDTHEATNTPFVRVATEKGQPPSARPIADLWAPAVSDAYDYLLERCSSARLRAKEIDERGFAFVTERLLSNRVQRPLEEGFQSQLDVLGLDGEQHFQIVEIVESFGLSHKEFSSGGRFRHCVIALPRIVAARVVRWMDARMLEWDWPRYSADRLDTRTGQVGTRSLSAAQISEYIGGGRACLAKADWFYSELRAFLVDLSQAGALEGLPAAADVIQELRSRWLTVRQQALATRGGGKCSAVNIERFVDAISTRYKLHLEQHYKDLVTYDDAGVPATGNGLRPGVPEKLSDHLIVVWEGEFSGDKSVGILPRPIFQADFYNYLCSNAQKRTIFERLNLLDESDKPYSITPHQIRHWVTTAIFRSGPSEMMVDLWMGRSAGQSRIYDHRTAKERAEAIRERYLSGDPPDDYLGRKVRTWTKIGLDSGLLEEHVKSRLRVLHFVPTGGCSRELFLSPCTKGLMCLRGFGTDSVCPSFHIDVDDEEAHTHIVTLREQYRAMLGALYPMAATLEEVFMEELNSSEVLDQHLIHIREVIRGCDQALAAYKKIATGERGARIIPVEVLT